MEMINILEGYNKRVNCIGSYYLIATLANNRNKFKEFDNIQFYNLLIQVLCYIFDRSLRRKNCLRDDIKDFIEEINRMDYKIMLSEDDLKDLANYIINGLTNSGKVYLFTYYSLEQEKHIDESIKIIEDKNVKINNQERLSYSLTTEGYRLLLSTKEYDELFQIQISQMIAKLRIEKGDYQGAKEDIYDIINTLEIHQQKIDNYIKIIKVNILYIKEEKYSTVIDTTVETLLEEMDKYEELKKEVKLLIKDKEDYLEKDEDIDKEKIKNIRTQLLQMKELIDGIVLAKSTATNLLSRVQDFREEFKEILKKLLTTPVIKRFNFKEEILDRLEKDSDFLLIIRELYISLFKVELPNRFNIGVAYQEQKLLNTREIENEIVNKDELEIIENKEKEERINYCENYYFDFFKYLIKYGLEKGQFTLEEFLKNYLKYDKVIYLEITKDSKLMRDIIIYFANQRESINIKKIIRMLENSAFSPNTDFQIERLIERLLVEDFELLNSVSHIKSNKIFEDEMKINTEINLETMTAVKLEIANIKFEII
ncbi:Uncharacterised protein [Clostridioides difficile]|uniref:Uncharacterized protein n=4 Tax=Clostridioides difficile TaxID=1496 RepID=A0A9R0CFR8_CLODR|nr:hypothetical protein [Clostridioides difficile]OFU02763.1 hypothetical protein HMPREF3085_07330 [Clostridium sp. HMSC19E03]OFU15289.1 hypothetical protein HMPREF3078_16610 [Clostridium sp. HMSC19C08]OFU18227.1 hypothetical protein HMPREF3079_08205 [Clostridium sp. HMSC19C09]OFU19025.1 hypothetical protein HMPREF3077_14030 [Clostridium sp. HMSC19C05]OFU34262.1 hypothetical protein HMPREF3074_04970 [Clostridium sp. HMSC19B10]OFU40580.1 hypothetical protein HMPREF3072_13015 [Clostridium sp. H